MNTLPQDRPWCVRDRLTQHRYYFDTDSEAHTFVDDVSTCEISGGTLTQWRSRLIVERNRFT
jgi:hypothetical protein